MTKDELVARLLELPMPTEETGRYYIRAMGGSYDMSDAASKQGGGTFQNYSWQGPLLHARDALTLDRLRTYITWSKQGSYTIFEDTLTVVATVNNCSASGKHPVCTLAACCVKIWGQDSD